MELEREGTTFTVDTLEQLHVPPHPGRGGVERRRGARQVVRLAGDLAQDAELVQGHAQTISKPYYPIHINSFTA